MRGFLKKEGEQAYWDSQAGFSAIVNKKPSMTLNTFPSTSPTVLASPKLMVWPDVTTFTLECNVTVIPMFLNLGFESLSWQISLGFGLVCLAREWHIQTGLNPNYGKHNLMLFRFDSSTHQWSQVDSVGLYMWWAGKVRGWGHEFSFLGCLDQGSKENHVWSLETEGSPHSAVSSFLSPRGKHIKCQVWGINWKIVPFCMNFV